jgi:hypothetical protein
MSDTPQFKHTQRPLPDPPVSNERAFEMFMRAFDDLFHAYQVMQDSVHHHSYETGFKAGVDACRKWLSQQLESNQGAPISHSQNVAVTANVIRGYDNPQKTGMERVHLFIIAHPGLRGVEIADAFAKSSAPLPERTVRTALHRLKPGRVRIVDGRWYDAKSAPADPQPQLIGGTDGPA